MLIFGFGACPVAVMTVSHTDPDHQMDGAAFCLLSGSRTRLCREERSRRNWGDFAENAGQCVPNLGPKRLAAVPPRGERSGLGPGGER